MLSAHSKIIITHIPCHSPAKAMALELLRQAIFGKTVDEPYVAAHSQSSGPRPVSQADWLVHYETYFNGISNEYKLVETTAADMVKIEELLEVAPGFFSSPYVVKTKEEHCQECGRRNNFLDVVATGLRVHKPSFLVDVFAGKYGYVLNTQTHQPCMCYGCGTLLPKSATKLSASKPLSAEALAAGKKQTYYIYWNQ